MAKIYMKRGRWCVDYVGADGKRRRELVTTDRSLAKDILAKKLAEVAEQRHFPSRAAESKPFNWLIDRYFALHGPRLRSNTWRLMLNDLRPALGSKRAGSITMADVEGYRNKIAARASGATANRHVSLIRAIFNKAKKHRDFYGENPCAGLKKLLENPGRTNYLSRDEMSRLLAVVHPRLRPILVCAVLTGMRKGEIMRLDWGDIDFNTAMIIVLQTKSGKSRLVPLASKLRDLLLTLGPRPQGRVFDLPDIMLRRYFERAFVDAGVKRIRFHDLRHTFASHFIMQTNNLPALQTILGHSSSALTLRYAHFSRAHLASEMAAMEAVVPCEGPSGALPAPALAQIRHSAPAAGEAAA